jgi:carboxylesterase type B
VCIGVAALSGFCGRDLTELPLILINTGKLKDDETRTMNSFLLWISYFFPSFFGIPLSKEEVPVIQLDYGRYRGFSASINTVAWLGIPYAKSPVGDLRFAPPVPLDSQIDPSVTNATKFGDGCWQKPDAGGMNGTGLYRSEDCLTLNIFAPRKHDKLLDVAVFVQGGGFDSGYSAHPYFNASAVLELTNANMIVVTFNYRVGAFGFLSSPDIQAKGYLNVGLMDQEAVFLWVKKYIQNWGGDPNSVTAVGQSAGAISIASLMASRNSELNLFQRAVLFSGGPGLILKYPQQDQENFNQIVTSTGCENSNDKLECLRKVDAEKLWLSSRGQMYFPVVDFNILKEQPLKTFLNGRFKKIPLLLSTVKDEGTLFTFPLVKSVAHIVPVERKLLPFLNATAFERLQELYPTSDVKSDEAFKVVGQIYGDVLFQCPSLLLALSSNQDAPVYKYLFDVSQPGILGVSHGSDLPYIWSFKPDSQESNNPESEFLVKQWSNFVTKANLSSGWEKFNGTRLRVTKRDNYMETDNDAEGRCAFWFNTISNLLNQ